MNATLLSNGHTAPISPAANSPTGAKKAPMRQWSYPEGTPRNERLPWKFVEEQHSIDTWTALITSDAIVEAVAIRAAAAALRKRLAAWLDKHGESDDPGADAIHNAGLTVPAEVEQYGTDLRTTAEHFAGLAWALMSFGDWTEDIPDPADVQNTPANVRRLLGE